MRSDVAEAVDRLNSTLADARALDEAITVDRVREAIRRAIEPRATYEQREAWERYWLIVRAAARCRRAGKGDEGVSPSVARTVGDGA